MANTDSPSAAAPHSSSPPEVPPHFGRIVCAVDGSRSSHEAVAQAITLAGPSTELAFVCVRSESGAGPTHGSNISLTRADKALREAVRAAAEAGVRAAAQVLPCREPPPVLLAEASRANLLVLASHVAWTAAGIMLGDTASTAVHRASVPVLVTRRPPEGVAFPERVLVATDGSPDAHRAVELAGRIAHRHGARLYIVSVHPARHGRKERIATEAAELTAELGVEPTIIRVPGHAHECIVETAASESVSLVAVGSRGLTGLRALGSVSERVAHHAPCSVLVARPA